MSNVVISAFHTIRAARRPEPVAVYLGNGVWGRTWKVEPIIPQPFCSPWRHPIWWWKFRRTERSSHAENKVGTGFTAAVRAELWEERDFVVGRVAKIKSFPVGTKDRPRHPVWLGWRNLEVDG